MANPRDGEAASDLLSSGGPGRGGSGGDLGRNSGDDGGLRVRVGSLVDRTEGAEGPGARFVLWTQGCTLGCPGCCNPHLWSAEGGELWTVEALLERVAAAQARYPDLEGVTLVGGEPFEQDAPLAAFAAGCRARGLTVMGFSGYTLGELRARGAALLEHLDLLVDGRFEQAARTTTRRWIGSTNQGLHHLSDAYAADDPRFREPNHAEMRLNGRGELQVVGFPFDSVRHAFGPASALAKDARRGRRLPGAGSAEAV